MVPINPLLQHTISQSPSAHSSPAPLTAGFLTGSAKSIRQRIWQGSIPVRFIVSEDEVKNFGSTVDFYISIPRIAYLPQYISTALKYLRNELNRPETADQYDWWAEFEGSPVKWNWPVGLSYDLLTGLDPTKDSDSIESHLPWTIVLHHQNYPKEHILALNSLSTVHDFWLNQIKESCVVRYGNAKAIMDISKEETNILWNSLKDYTKDSYIQFWKILDSQIPMKPNAVAKFTIAGNSLKLFESSVQMGGSLVINGVSVESSIRSHSDNLRNIPIKIYLPTSSSVLQPPVSPYYRDENTSRRLSGGTKSESGLLERSTNLGIASHEGNHNSAGPAAAAAAPVITMLVQTVGSLLNMRLPELFPSKRTCILARPIVHGVEVPLSVPLLELIQEACYADGFVHLSIVMMS